MLYMYVCIAYFLYSSTVVFVCEPMFHLSSTRVTTAAGTKFLVCATYLNNKVILSLSPVFSDKVNVTLIVSAVFGFISPFIPHL